MYRTMIGILCVFCMLTVSTAFTIPDICYQFQYTLLGLPFAPTEDNCWSAPNQQQRQCCYLYQQGKTPSINIYSGQSTATLLPTGATIGFDMNGVITWLAHNIGGFVLNQPWNPCTLTSKCTGGIQMTPQGGICCSVGMGLSPTPTLDKCSNKAGSNAPCLPCNPNLIPLVVGNLNTSVTIYLCVDPPPPPPKCLIHGDCVAIGCADKNRACCCNFASNTCQNQYATCNCLFGGAMTDQYGSNCCGGGPIALSTSIYICPRTTNWAPASLGMQNSSWPQAPNDNYCLVNCYPNGPGGCDPHICIENCSCNCFEKNTFVQTYDATKKISELTPGELIWCPSQQRYTRLVGVNKLERRRRPLYMLSTTPPLLITDGHIIYGGNNKNTTTTTRSSFHRRWAVNASMHQHDLIFNVSSGMIMNIPRDTFFDALAMNGIDIINIQIVDIQRTTYKETKEDEDEWLYSLVLDECHAHTANGITVSDMFPDLVKRPDITNIVYHLWRQMAVGKIPATRKNPGEIKTYDPRHKGLSSQEQANLIEYYTSQ